MTRHFTNGQGRTRDGRGGLSDRSFRLTTEVRQAHRNDTRDALLLLADAVDEIRTRNRVLVVSDDQELRLHEELLELFDEAPNVRIVKSGVKFVQHTERSRLDHEDREQ